jgi:hypothetical protein
MLQSTPFPQARSRVARFRALKTSDRQRRPPQPCKRPLRCTSQSTQKNELVVLIKATIIHDSKDWGHDLDDTQRRIKPYDLGEAAR